MAQALSNLAGHYKSYVGQYAKAEPLYQRRSLKIRETGLGSDLLEVANSLNEIGMYHAFRGQFAEAESFYQRAA